MLKHLLKSFGGLCLAMPLLVYAAPPKIAVSNLAYEEKVEEYFRVVAASSQDNFSASNTHVRANSSNQYLEVEGTSVRIDRGELRRFTSDIKGELLKLHSVQLVEAQGYKPTKNNEKLFDVIARIKRGEFKGADYVLFGTVSAIDVQDNAGMIAGSSAASAVRNMELVADFSLVNTRNYGVKAAFSAKGEGSDVKLINAGSIAVKHQNGKIVAEVSKSLGKDVVSQLTEQFRGLGSMAVENTADMREQAPPPAKAEEVMILTPQQTKDRKSVV